MSFFRKASIVFKMIWLCTKFSFFIRNRDILFCLQTCQRPGFLKSLGDMELADRCIRRLFKFFLPRNPCLVHCLAMAQAAESSLKIYFAIQTPKAPPQHAYVKFHEHLFSTSNVYPAMEHLLIWEKGC
jgi:hypothetical protein